jgi:hypothetical protein
VTEEATKKELTQKIIEELGVLISSRISRYHYKFHKNDEVMFFNKFIVCPDEDMDGDDLLSYGLANKLHFDEFVDIGLEHFEIRHFFLTKDRSSITYCFSWIPVGICTIDNLVLLNFQLEKTKIHFTDPSAIIFFEGLEESFLIDILKTIRKEISFGILSRD